MAFSWSLPHAPPQSAAKQALENVIAPHRTLFKYYDKLKDDLGGMLERYKSLTPAIQNLGPHLKLLAITGLLPFTYKLATYNVPITIWIPYGYPDDLPTVSVVPTGDLTVPANHAFVSPQGHVDFKKLGFIWDPSYHSTFLVETLQQAFGSNPPLRSRPPGLGSSQTGHSTSLVTQSPPAYAKPTASTQPSGYGQPNLGNNTSRSPSPAYTVVTSSQPPNSSSMMGIQPTFPQNTASHNSHKPDENDKADLDLITAIQVLSTYETMVKEEQEKDALVEETLSKAQYSRDFVQKQLEDSTTLARSLQASEQQLTSEIQKTEAWLKANADADDGVINFDACGEPEDALLRAALPFHAKDLAIEDTLYYLEKALQNNTIDLKQFLKATRDLATDQYYQRATLRKLNVHFPPVSEY